MSQSDDRIKLALAMGWVFPEGHQTWAVPPNHPDPPGHGNVREIPDPFTSADDDYTVLEWMRSHEGEQLYKYGDAQFAVRLERGHTADGVDKYQIGDYARAALKVLDE